MGRRVTQTALRDFAALLEARVTKRRSFDCLITGDAELQRLNKQFRKKNYPTDVLSFPVPSRSGAAAPRKLKFAPPLEPELGELAISADRALVQAREHGHSLADELKILMLHGVLHLTGLDHEAASDEGAMESVEKRWRKVLELPNGLIERTTQS